MKKGALILLAGLIICVIGFAGAYFACSNSHRQMAHAPSPELAWLQAEFHLSDSEFARVSRLHNAYLPQCAERCRIINAQNEKLAGLLARNSAVTPEVTALLADRAKTRADCEAAMLQHFLDTSRAMPPAQGRRYLAWVAEHTFLRMQTMEKRHEDMPGEPQ